MKKKKGIIVLIAAIILFSLVFLWFLVRTKISKKEALNLAYEYIGSSKESFSYVKIEKDFLDNSYDIKLADDTYNYEIEIDGKSGATIDFEKKPIMRIQNQTDSVESSNQSEGQTNTGNQNVTYIRKEEAQAIALNHAGLTEKDVAFTKINRELENSTMVYEIEFMYNYLEYEYEIDAVTGSIVKFKKDR